MSERGLPPDAAPACPFVAFEDDRDARSTVPDHRHRCFAEPRPAPRAIAHQEAYCLSSAFPVCPTFQDWARREAAAARATPSSAAPAGDETAPASRPMPPVDRDAQHPSDFTPADVAPRRNPPRDWAAPPPWTGDPSDPRAAQAGTVGQPQGEGIAGNADVPVIPPRTPSPSSPPGDAAASDDWGAQSRGLAGSAAYRLAGPDPDEPEPAAPRADDEDDDWSTGAAATA